MRENVKEIEITKQKEQARLRELELENERLRREKESLEKLAKAPVDEAIKQTPENQELERAKDFYVQKNIEVEQLIKQVMGEKAEAPKDLKPESIESLLKFLVYIVLNKEEGSG